MTRPSYLIFFDAHCQICQRSRQMIHRLAPNAPVRFIDANNPRELARYPQMNGADTRGQMHVLDPTGHLSGGYDALVALTPILPLVAWSRGLLNRTPIRALGRRIYRWLAANRYRLGGQVSCREGACQLNPTPSRG